MKYTHLLRLSAAALLVALLSTSCADDLIDDPNCGSDLINFRVVTDATRSAADQGGCTPAMCKLTEPGSKDTLYMYSHITDLAARVGTTRGALNGALGDFKVSCARQNPSDGQLLTYYFKDQEYSPFGLPTDGRSYYWLNTGTQDFRFFAVAQESASGVSTPQMNYSTSTSYPKLTYSVPTDPTYQIDLKAVTTEAYSDTWKQPVPLTFKHLTTGIVFTAAEDILDGYIMSITFEGVKYSGTYDMDTSEWTLEGGTSTFTKSFGTDGLYVDDTHSTITPDGEATFFMMPQTLPDGAKVTVVYKDKPTGNIHRLTANLDRGVWPEGNVVNYIISSTGVSAKQVGLNIIGNFDSDVVAGGANLTLNLLGNNTPLTTTTLSTTSFQLNAPNFIDNLVAALTSAESSVLPSTNNYLTITATNQADNTKTQTLIVDYKFDYMQITVQPNAGEEVILPFRAGNSGGDTPSTLMFNWDYGTNNTYSAQLQSLTLDAQKHTYSGTGPYKIRIYSNCFGTEAAPYYRFQPAQVDGFWFPTSITSVDTPLLPTGQNDLSYLFNEATKLTTINENIFSKFPQLTDLGHTFYGCTSLTQIPEYIFRNNNSLSRLSHTFENCTSVTSIPANLLKNHSSITSFDCTFQGCSSLQKIPAHLFDDNVNATSFYYTFFNCSGLQGYDAIPDELFYKCPNANNFDRVFSGCWRLIRVPDHLFDKNTKAQNMGFAFAGCSNLSAIPNDFFKYNTSVTTFAGTFQNCSSITRIPLHLFDTNTQVQNFESTFNNCSSLTSIPSGLFDNNPLVTNFIWTFNGCTNIQNIPTDLFKYNTAAREFISTFYGCSSITSIPSGLFSTNTEATNFERCFSGCTGIMGQLPAGLFKNLSNVYQFNSTFENCKNLGKVGGIPTYSIPADLFEGCSNANNFEATFKNCEGLTGSIPANLFKDINKEITNKFNETFYGCQNLTGEIPGGLFQGQTQVIELTKTFYNCPSLTSINANLLSSMSNLQRVNGLFSWCAGLTSIPANLFAGNPNLTEFNGTFLKCTGLTAIPGALFNNITNYATRRMVFTNTFYGCSSISGYVPTLWERFTKTKEKNGCFGSLTDSQITNYSDIPPEWINGGSATLSPPRHSNRHTSPAKKPRR